MARITWYGGYNGVLTIVGEPKWYGEWREYKRGIVYRLAYGMFRLGYNQWALHGAQEWMNKHCIVYGKDLVYKKVQNPNKKTSNQDNNNNISAAKRKKEKNISVPVRVLCIC